MRAYHYVNAFFCDLKTESHRNQCRSFTRSTSEVNQKKFSWLQCINSYIFIFDLWTIQSILSAQLSGLNSQF